MTDGTHDGELNDAVAGRAELALLDAFDAATDVIPHLMFEIGYTRATDWMVHIWDKTGGVEKKLVTTQSYDREEACLEAIKELKAVTGI